MPITRPTPEGETIRGTSGSDTLAGRGGDDRLIGGGGRDFFLEGTFGWPGRLEEFFDLPDVPFGERVDFGSGNDFYDGGGGRDLLSYFLSFPSVVIDFGTNTVTRGDEVDRFIRIEEFQLGEEDDTVIGLDRDTSGLFGYLGTDTLDLRDASAIVRISVQGGDGNTHAAVSIGTTHQATATDFERYYGATNHRNIIEGSSTSEVFYGGRLNDRIDGGFGDDVIYGFDGDDFLRSSGGFSGARVFGGDGDDRIEGGGGSPGSRFFGGNGNDSFLALGFGSFYGGIGDDTFTLHRALPSSFSAAYGQAGDDYFTIAGGNRAFGGAGADVIRIGAQPGIESSGNGCGGAGTDTLILEGFAAR